jgi:hypothetical protein
VSEGRPATAGADGRLLATGPKWWGRPLLISLVAFGSALPLLWPAIPPLSDLPGHLGRYHVELVLSQSATLQRWYDFHWAPLGNLGVDLLILPLGRMFGVELGTKLLVMAIPPLSVAGYIATARAVHHRVPPLAWLTAPLAYSYPFQFGFVNFCLGVALAFLAFALWVHMERRGGLVRIVLFAGVAPLLWLTHIYGWAVLCILVGSRQLARRAHGDKRPLMSWAGVMLPCTTLLTPLLIMLAFPAPTGRPLAEDWFNLVAKSIFLVSPLRDHWREWDILSALLLIGVAAVAALSKTIILVALFILMPRTLIGSTLADMRIVPVALACGLLMARPAADDASRDGRLAMLALGFTAARLTATTASFLAYDRQFGQELAAVDFIPRGASMVALVGSGRRDGAGVSGWSLPRNGHLPSLALVRRDAFADDQFVTKGQLLTLRGSPVAGIARDPDQYASTGATMLAKLNLIDPSRVSALWLIDDPRGPAPPPRGFKIVWRDRLSSVALSTVRSAGIAACLRLGPKTCQVRDASNAPDQVLITSR